MSVNPPPSADIEQRFAHVFAEEERRGLLLSSRVRSIILFAILIWYVWGRDRPWEELDRVVYINAFFFLGVLQYVLARAHRALDWFPYLLTVLDAALLAAVMTLPDPFCGNSEPVAMTFRESAVIFLLVFLIPPVFSYRWQLVVWTGACIAAAWTAVLLIALQDPNAFVLNETHIQAASIAVQMLDWDDPHFIDVTTWASEFLVIVLITGGLAVAVHRSRRLVARQAVSERARSNLARYFSPQVVDELQERDEAIGRPRSLEAAVMFVDIVGFTSLSERRDPERVMRLLREFCSLVEGNVFAERGTLEKFIGDGAMAVFGVPQTRPDDAVRALAAAERMLDDLDAWNDRRVAEGRTRLAMGIGLHFGRVVAGDVGSERTKSFTIIGDTVNTASRIEGLTRTLDCRLLVSDSFAAAVRAVDEHNAALARLQALGPQAVKGRVDPITVWGRGKLHADLPADTPESA